MGSSSACTNPSGPGVFHSGGMAQRALPVSSESYYAKKMLLEIKSPFLRVKVMAAATLPALFYPRLPRNVRARRPRPPESRFC